jgi:hypothetical protein
VPVTQGCNHVATVTTDLDLDGLRERMVAAGAEIGEIQRLGNEWSLFFRDPDGMELEVCAHAAPDD